MNRWLLVLLLIDALALLLLMDWIVDNLPLWVSGLIVVSEMALFGFLVFQESNSRE